MRKTVSRIILSLSLLLVLAGTAGLAISAGEKKPEPQKKEEPRSAKDVWETTKKKLSEKDKKDGEQSKTAKPAKEEAPPQRKIFLLEIDAPITPVVAEYIVKSISRAADKQAEAIIIQLDTPGGLVDSMREIVKKMISAEVPVVVYVGPSGARAASAGVFITMAAHIAAMAPSTNIGAASPVQMDGKMDETMASKITNDLSAMVRGVAEKRGRNAKWAEEAVRKAVSITEKEALKNNVIDLIAPDVPSLVKAMDGRTVEVLLGKRTLKTKDAVVEPIEMGFRYKLLSVISNPNIAYILMILGFYGLYFELSNPGAIFPGVAGAICLILAFYALQTLPINYAGLMLIILGVSLFIAEAFIASGGILGVGGAVAMVFGSVMLIDSPEPFMRVSWSVIIPVVAMSALLFIITLTIAIRIHREQPDTGSEGLVGREAEARTDIATEGQVFVHGEYWNAVSDEPVKKGERVKIIAVDGLKVKVKRT